MTSFECSSRQDRHNIGTLLDSFHKCQYCCPLGYSVTAGRFLGDHTSYVGGAPRSNGTGQVVFFSRDKVGESLLLVDLILDGEMFASSFGFEVLAVDINNDE